MSQTAYTLNQPIAYAGLLGDMADNEVHSKINTTGAAMTFGVGVVRGTAADTDMKLPASSGDVTNKLAGVLAHSHAGQSKAAAAAGLADKEIGNVLAKGNVWVTVEQAVTPDDPVFLRHTANGPLLPGAWRKDADTANATQVTRAKWLTSAGINGFALLALNLP